MEKFYCDNFVIRDDYDRQRIFKGINVCSKEKQNFSKKI